MAIRKLDVIGKVPVGGVGPGGVCELDDAIYNVDALIQGELVAEHKEPEPKKAESDLKSFKKKGD